MSKNNKAISAQNIPVNSLEEKLHNTKPIDQKIASDSALDAVWCAYSNTYGLKDESAFDNLLEFVTGLACRNQEDDADKTLTLATRRARAHAAGKKLQSLGYDLLRTIDKITESYGNLHDALQYNPSLMEAVFDLDTGPPDNVFLPDELCAIDANRYDIDYAKMERWAAALAALPIKPRLKRGRIENVVLREAVSACRDYWIRSERRSWTMSALKHRETRLENEAAHLQGECERFVSAVLAGCGIRFTLYDLSSAWTAVDAQASTLVKNGQG